MQNKRITCLIMSVVLLFATLIGGSFTTSLFAYAEEKDYRFTNVLDDLQSSEEFKLEDYTLNGEIKVIQVTEYGYAYDKDKRSLYGLYIYVHNGTGKAISRALTANSVQIGVKYDSLPITRESKVLDYETFQLEFCSTVESGEYQNRFYKFKVVDHYSKDGKKIVDRVDSKLRRYDVSGIELLTEGELTAKDSNNGQTVYYEGYAKGLGPNGSENTLSGSVRDLTTLKLDVNNTFYRTGLSQAREGYQNQIDSVYFSVPNEVLNTYGSLQRVKAEWYEFRTKNILVADNQRSLVNDKTLYENLQPFVGKPSSIVTENTLLDNLNHLYLYSEAFHDTSFNYYFDHWGSLINNGIIESSLNNFYALFPANNGISAYDPYADVTSLSGVNGNILYQHYLDNPLKFTEYLPIKDGKTVPKGYFEDDIPSSRRVSNEFGKIQYGYSYYDFDASVSLADISVYGTNTEHWKNNKTWSSFWNSLFGNIPEYVLTDSDKISPILPLSNDEFSSALTVEKKQELADKYYINYSDVDNVSTKVAEADSTTFLFRFAVSDYYSQALKVSTRHGILNLHNRYDNADLAYVAQQEVFFDFDIIQLTFAKDGTLFVMPVVANPVDIVNDITTPVVVNEDEPDWFRIILGLLALIILLIIIMPILPKIFEIIIWIISLPFKFIGWIINKIRGE